MIGELLEIPDVLAWGGDGTWGTDLAKAKQHQRSTQGRRTRSAIAAARREAWQRNMPRSVPESASLQWAHQEERSRVSPSSPHRRRGVLLRADTPTTDVLIDRATGMRMEDVNVARLTPVSACASRGGRRHSRPASAPHLRDYQVKLGGVFTKLKPVRARKTLQCAKSGSEAGHRSHAGVVLVPSPFCPGGTAPMVHGRSLLHVSRADQERLRRGLGGVSVAGNAAPSPSRSPSSPSAKKRHTALAAVAARAFLGPTSPAHRSTRSTSTAAGAVGNSAHKVFGVGVGRQRAGDIDGAIEAYRRAIDFDPHLAAAHSNLSLCLQTKGDYEGSLEAAEMAVEISEEDSVYRYNLGTSLLAAAPPPEKKRKGERKRDRRRRHARAARRQEMTQKAIVTFQAAVKLAEVEAQLADVDADVGRRVTYERVRAKGLMHVARLLRAAGDFHGAAAAASRASEG